VLVTGVRFTSAYYYGSFTPIRSYRIEALWRAALPLIVVRSNDENPVSHPFPAGFATTALRIVIDGLNFYGLAEVEIDQDFVPADTPTFTDPFL
jgi:hypothetical protein